MKHFQTEDILKLDKRVRTNFIHNLSGYKQAFLVATRSRYGETNLAVMSSIVHVGSNPPLLGFIIRPDSVPRHTLENIRVNRVFTLNQVPEEIVAKAHMTSARFERAVSEFEATGLTVEYLDDYPTPFVKESHLKISLQLAEEVPVRSNGTFFIVGRVDGIYLPDDLLEEDGMMDLTKIQSVTASGLNRYYRQELIAEYPYAKANNRTQETSSYD